MRGSSELLLKFAASNTVILRQIVQDKGIVGCFDPPPSLSRVETDIALQYYLSILDQSS